MKSEISDLFEDYLSVLKPKEVYTYSSYCMLISPVGSMNGFYEMINFSTSEKFQVKIPTFQLMIPATLN